MRQLLRSIVVQSYMTYNGSDTCQLVLWPGWPVLILALVHGSRHSLLVLAWAPKTGPPRFTTLMLISGKQSSMGFTEVPLPGPLLAWVLCVPEGAVAQSEMDCA